MFKRTFSGRARGASKSTVISPGRSPGARLGHFKRNNHSGFSQRRFNQRQKIDISRFINRAVVAQQTEQFVPQHRFQEFMINEKLKANIHNKNYIQPTPIQDKTIPLILAGKDVVGIANTGTGKTAAFLVPLINKVLLDRREKVLILVPTRELALQIQQEFMAFTRFLGLNSALCIGGAAISPQIYNLKRNPHFIIATPGRLKDLIQRRYVSLANFRNIVLDEADRMLDMGFIHDIKFLLSLMPKERHSLFFSATISSEIQALIRNFMCDPVTISVKVRDTASNIDQDVVCVPDKSKKVDLLHGLLTKNEFNKVLVFGRTKHGVEKLSLALAKRGFKVESIHGNKTHSRRQKALQLFKQNQVQVLVATDVAARGLDIFGVSHVINYDLPATYDDYIHRIGRTGRADKKGKALTFVE